MAATPPAGTPDRIRLYIDGKWVDALDGETFDVLNPTTNEVYIQAWDQHAPARAVIEHQHQAYHGQPGPRVVHHAQLHGHLPVRGNRQRKGVAKAVAHKTRAPDKEIRPGRPREKRPYPAMAQPFE